MFDFNEEKLTDEQIMNIAIQDGLPYHLRYSEEEVEMAIGFYRKAKSLLIGK